MRTSLHSGSTGKHPAFPTRWFTAYSALSPGTNCFFDPVIRDALASYGLDACKGAPEPHGFAVRKTARSSVAPPASTASRPANVTIACRPFWWGGTTESILLIFRFVKEKFGKSENNRRGNEVTVETGRPQGAPYAMSIP